MNSIIQDDLDKGEAIYPGMPVYAIDRDDDVHPGIGRVWLYWTLQSDTRVTKTVITYTFNGETYSIEKPVSESSDENYYAGYSIDSLEVTGLEEGYYSFSVYTVDADKHRSITSALYPQIVQVYGNIYINSLTTRSIEKMEMLPGGNLQLTWAKAADNVVYSVVEYRDHSKIPSGKPTVDTVFNEPTPTVSVLNGFKKFKTFSVRSLLKVGIDTAEVESFHVPPVVEKALLETLPNRFDELTEAKANTIEELTYPLGIAAWTLQDLYYFPNLRKLNLMPGTDALPLMNYQREYIDKIKGSDGDISDTIRYASTIGGIPWLNFVSGYMSDSDIAIIGDLLESGQLTEVQYTRNSYPKLDAVLEPYGSKIKWSPTEPLPDYGILIPHNLFVDYRLESRDNGVKVNARDIYTEDGSNVPEAIKTKFEGVNGLNNVYKIVIKSRRDDADGGDDTNADNLYGKKGRNTIAFAIPADLQFGFVPNGRLKFDCYIDIGDDEYKWMRPADISKYDAWRTIKFFNSRKLSNNFPDDSPYVAEDFTVGDERNRHGSGTFEILAGDNVRRSFPDTDLGKWYSFDVTHYNLDFANMAKGHYRVLRIQLGSDDGTPWGVPTPLTYYIANLRWAK
jgi:hypothetical protein